MKKALQILDKKIRCATIDAHLLAVVHDEFQLEVIEGREEEVGQMAIDSIKEAGEYFKLRCPLSGEYKVGNTWKDTH